MTSIVIKMYALKSKASTVIMNIGLKSKKKKIQDEMKKSKKEIGLKMQNEDNEFMNLLHEQTVAF